MLETSPRYWTSLDLGHEINWANTQVKTATSVWVYPMSSPRGRKIEKRYELRCFGLFYCIDDSGVVYIILLLMMVVLFILFYCVECQNKTSYVKCFVKRNIKIEKVIFCDVKLVKLVFRIHWKSSKMAWITWETNGYLLISCVIKELMKIEHYLLYKKTHLIKKRKEKRNLPPIPFFLFWLNTHSFLSLSHLSPI